MVLGSMGRYWLVLGGIGSVQGGNVCYMVVLGLYRAELDGTWSVMDSSSFYYRANMPF